MNRNPNYADIGTTRPDIGTTEPEIGARIQKNRLRMAGALVSLLPVAVGASTGYFTARNMNNERAACLGNRDCLVGKSSEAASDTVGAIGGLMGVFSASLVI